MAKEDFKARGAKDDHAARCFMQIVVDRYYLPPDTDVFVFFCLLKNPKNSQNSFCIQDSNIAMCKKRHSGYSYSCPSTYPERVVERDPHDITPIYSRSKDGKKI